MRLQWLRLYQFRNYLQFSMEFPEGPIFLIGPNATGKTNLLEAIYILSTGVSHRTARDRELANWEAESFSLRGAIENRGRSYEIDVQWRQDAKEVCVDGVPLGRRSELMSVVATVLFCPEDLLLVKGEPRQRRRLLDRLTAVREPRHGADLLTFRQLLQQRNQLLRDVREKRTSREMAGLFDDQFTALASRILARRMATLSAVQPLAGHHLQRLTGGSELFHCTYLFNALSGVVSIPNDEAAGETGFWRHQLETALHGSSEDEIERGRTLIGPQRDDFRITLNGYDARQYASQGQQRSLVLALKLAEMDLFHQTRQVAPILLLDDVLSELDQQRAAALLEAARRQEQTFITATEAAVAQSGDILADAHLYRVRNGSLEEHVM